MLQSEIGRVTNVEDGFEIAIPVDDTDITDFETLILAVSR